MSKIKKAIAVVTVVCMCLCMPGVGVMAEEISSMQSMSDVSLYNIAITKTKYEFDISSDGLATCYSTVDVQNGYTVQLTMQLQQKNSMWKTVESWTNTDTSFVLLDETYQVEKGYDYRLMVVYIAYDSEGNQVESFYDVSDTKGYR